MNDNTTVMIAMKVEVVDGGDEVKIDTASNNYNNNKVDGC